MARHKTGRRIAAAHDVAARHQLRIARDTLRMSDTMARVMGGPTKAEAQAIIARLTKRNPGVSGETAAEDLRNALSLALYFPGPVTDEQDQTVKAIAVRIDHALKKIEGVYTALPHSGRGRTVQRNPALAILGNPKPTVSLKATWAKLEYVRPDDPDGKRVVRTHEFPQGFWATGLDDGSVHLWHPRRRLWTQT